MLKQKMSLRPNRFDGTLLLKSGVDVLEAVDAGLPRVTEFGPPKIGSRR